MNSSQSASSNPVAFFSYLIATLLPDFQLDQASENQVREELLWLGYATENFRELFLDYQQQVAKNITAQWIKDQKAELRRAYLGSNPSRDQRRAVGDYVREQIKRVEQQTKVALWTTIAEQSHPVSHALPSTIQTGQANNQMVATDAASEIVLEFDDRLRRREQPFDHELKLLELNLARYSAARKTAAELGTEANVNSGLHADFRVTRIGLLEALQKIAEIVNPLYGVNITVPTLLLDLI